MTPFKHTLIELFRDIFMDMKASSPPFKCQSHSLQFSIPTRSLALATGRLHKHEGLPEVIYGELQQLLNFSHLKCGMFFDSFCVGSMLNTINKERSHSF